ncbi:MAG: type II secretion system protein, partial [Pseudomonadota bacterium]
MWPRARNNFGKLRRQRGFSLLEVLVAFSILAISLGVLLNIFSSGMRMMAIAEEYTRASQVAESMLAKVGVEIPVEEGVDQGIEGDRFRWTLSVRPYTLDLEELDLESLSMIPYRVEVKVEWGDGESVRSVELTTL